MTQAHITNTNFEAELEGVQKLSLIELLTKPKFAIQLQYLPLLFKEKDEPILVTHQTDEKIADVFLIDNYAFSSADTISSWGYSNFINEYALQKQAFYQKLDINCVKKVNSKLFSFELGPKLEGAKLLDENEKVPVKGVLKSAFGFSARGHFHLDQGKDPSDFLKKEFSKGLKVIYEPWVERILDFSTQWFIDKAGSIDYLGATVLKNSSNGAYLGSITGKEAILFGRYLPFLKEHKEYALDCLKKIKGEGFWGNVGIDSMIYNDCKKNILHPIVEINARKTLGYALLSYWQKNWCSSLMYAYFTTPQNVKKALLPSSVIYGDKKITFDRQLTFELISPFL
jgi:hypothetical protein